MTRLFLALTLCAWLLVPGVAPAGKGYTIVTSQLGALAVVGGQVVVTKEFDEGNGVEDLWYFEAAEPGQGMVDRYIRLQANGKYLTANERGEVYLSDKPEEGSAWGVEVPRDSKAESGLGTLGGRALDVIWKPETIKDAKGKARSVCRVKVGPRPGPTQKDKNYPRFVITLISP